MSDAAPTLDELVASAHRLGAACLERKVRVAAAESCTGGLVGHVLTEIAGSSEWFAGTIVAYADDVKRSVLGVTGDSIDSHGAVSAQVAVAMAVGVRRALGTPLAVSVTGIAGPGGGTDAKPVGLTYVAVADEAGSEVRRHLWGGDRAANKRASAAAALELLLERLSRR
jgi:PncC family amidohydrolase